jgi:carbamoyl-phosphate synthase small subunit
MRGIVSLIDHDETSLKKKVQRAPQMVGLDLATVVTIDKRYDNTDKNVNFVEFSSLADFEPSPFHVVAYDFGIKSHILRNLTRCGARVTVVPATMPAEEIWRISTLTESFFQTVPATPSHWNTPSRT